MHLTPRHIFPQYFCNFKMDEMLIISIMFKYDWSGSPEKYEHLKYKFSLKNGTAVETEPVTYQSRIPLQ